jgi:hypothetical protein
MTNVGLVGCGKISGIYLDNAPRLDGVRFVACTDVDAERAREVARERGIRALTAEELLNDPEVEVVLCLTPPDFHAEVMLQAIAAGKHVYTEKPLATSVERAREVLEAAAAAGVLDRVVGGRVELDHEVARAAGLRRLGDRLEVQLAVAGDDVQPAVALGAHVLGVDEQDAAFEAVELLDRIVPGHPDPPDIGLEVDSRRHELAPEVGGAELERVVVVAEPQAGVADRLA